MLLRCHHGEDIDFVVCFLYGNVKRRVRFRIRGRGFILTIYMNVWIFILSLLLCGISPWRREWNIDLLIVLWHMRRSKIYLRKIKRWMEMWYSSFRLFFQPSGHLRIILIEKKNKFQTYSRSRSQEIFNKYVRSFFIHFQVLKKNKTFWKEQGAVFFTLYIPIGLIKGIIIWYHVLVLLMPVWCNIYM